MVTLSESIHGPFLEPAGQLCCIFSYNWVPPCSCNQAHAVISSANTCIYSCFLCSVFGLKLFVPYSYSVWVVQYFICIWPKLKNHCVHRPLEIFCSRSQQQKTGSWHELAHRSWLCPTFLYSAITDLLISWYHLHMTASLVSEARSEPTLDIRDINLHLLFIFHKLIIPHITAVNYHLFVNTLWSCLYYVSCDTRRGVQTHVGHWHCQVLWTVYLSWPLQWYQLQG